MQRNIIYLFTILLLLLFSARCPVSDEDLRAAHTAYKNGAIIIDVRTREEYKENHIEKS